MGFCVVKGDLLEMKYDAIVIPSQPSLKLEGVIGGKIKEKCGDILLTEIDQLKNINIGECTLTNAYNLDCKKLILVANPKWEDGNNNEEQDLHYSYLSCLEKAQDFGLESIAFPLLSAGAYKFPKRRAIEIAVETITDFLEDNDIEVALVIYEENTFKTYKDIFKQYVIKGGHLAKMSEHDRYMIMDERTRFSWYVKNAAQILDDGVKSKEFNKRMQFFMTQKGLNKFDCYNGIVSKSAFNNIMNGTIPKKDTIVSLGINMGLDVNEINELLEPIGELLDERIERDNHIMHCIYQGKSVDEINESIVLLGFVPLKTAKL